MVQNGSHRLTEEVQGCESGDRHAGEQQRGYGRSDARPGAHGQQLQRSGERRHVGDVGRVVALLPVRPSRRRLVVGLRHPRLPDPPPEHRHALVHQRAPVVVPAERAAAHRRCHRPRPPRSQHRTVAGRRPVQLAPKSWGCRPHRRLQ